MSRYIMKASPDRDLYVEWSTVTDHWIVSGTRVEMLEYLNDFKYVYGNLPEATMKHCDETGTSVRYYLTSTSDVIPGSWDDLTIRIMNYGTINRSDLGTYLDALNDRNEELCKSLITPFEWVRDLDTCSEVFE